jgi:hypothetical protein
MAGLDFAKLGGQFMDWQRGGEFHRQVQEIVTGKTDRRVGVDRGNRQRAEVPAQFHQRAADVLLWFDVAADADASPDPGSALVATRKGVAGLTVACGVVFLMWI